jgi:hypothetical protein
VATHRRSRFGRAVILATLASLAVAAPAAAHGGGHPRPAANQAAGGAVKLRDCWMTVGYLPRPAARLLEVFRMPPDLSQTFYGRDPLLGVWALSCARAKVGEDRVGRVIVSLVGVPMGLTSVGAPPLANFFAHSLIAVDTSSPALARALRRAGLPGRVARTARYRHSRPGALPFTGKLTVPGRYRLRVSAREPDPTNPHDHSNLFSYRGRTGRVTQLGLSAGSAFDRFCLPASGGCRASLGAERGSGLGRLFGDTSAPARIGFDHAKLRRVGLALGRA